MKEFDDEQGRRRSLLAEAAKESATKAAPIRREAPVGLTAQNSKIALKAAQAEFDASLVEHIEAKARSVAYQAANALAGAAFADRFEQYDSAGRLERRAPKPKRRRT